MRRPSRRSTRAWRMNSSRAPAGSTRSYADRAAARRSAGRTASPARWPRPRRRRASHRGSPYERLHEVGADALGPLRLDRRHPPGPQPVRLDQLGRHHPPRRLAWPAPSRARSRTCAPRAPRYSRASRASRMPRCDSRPASTDWWTWSGWPASVPARTPRSAATWPQLAVQVLPLAHPQVVEVLGAAQPPELVRRQRPLPLAQVVPQGHDRQQVGARHVEPAVQLVGRARGAPSGARGGPGSTGRRR